MTSSIHQSDGIFDYVLYDSGLSPGRRPVASPR
jgi:hypothetical protein